ncbi:MAG: hypothetical protein R3C97_16905 [Geminicoccaceae bacterium]
MARWPTRQALTLRQEVARRLGERGQGGWQVRTSDEGELIFHRQLGERRVRHRLEPALAGTRGTAAGGGDGSSAACSNNPCVLERKDQKLRIDGPVSCSNQVLQLGRKGLSIQRYKARRDESGQLWETTLDPEIRSLISAHRSCRRSRRHLHHAHG